MLKLNCHQSKVEWSEDSKQRLVHCITVVQKAWVQNGIRKNIRVVVTHGEVLSQLVLSDANTECGTFHPQKPLIPRAQSQVINVGRNVSPTLRERNVRRPSIPFLVWIVVPIVLEMTEFRRRRSSFCQSVSN